MPGTLKEEAKKNWGGLIVLLIILAIFIFLIVKHGDKSGGIKTNNTLLNSDNIAQAVIPSGDVSEDKDLVSLVYSEVSGVNCDGQRTVYFGSNVQQAVASVVLNRVKDPNFPSNVHDVVYQQSQFASVYTNTMVPYDAIPESDRAAIQSAVDAAKTTDNTGGALFYYTTYQMNNPSRDAYIRTLPGVTVIDEAVFMKTFPS